MGDYRRHARSKADDTGWKCFYCGGPLDKSSITADHVHPKSKGGKDNYGNIVPACGSCNSRKSSLSVEEFRARTERRRDRLEERRRRRTLTKIIRAEVFNEKTGEWIPLGAQNKKRVTEELLDSGKYQFR